MSYIKSARESELIMALQHCIENQKGFLNASQVLRKAAESDESLKHPLNALEIAAVKYQKQIAKIRKELNKRKESQAPKNLSNAFKL